eukprot:NODE_361_length_2598_cov_52.821818_g341_i0.p1 GENE.NODE_361_length_2598_cov_52.821818_g341_i0~~NODE_361_length_2598_cov_52.821818_g341_i0.p1  ORF type:complete len:795 (+),score=199.10 NODE_361_length_2598_cov_52.821818_g341_i0:61-2385(+)
MDSDSARKVGKRVIREFQARGITVAAAEEDASFHVRIANPSCAKAILTLVRHRCSQLTPRRILRIAPRLFLSAYLCLGKDFLDPDNGLEADLRSEALTCLTAFELACGALLVEGDECDPQVAEALTAFATSWEAYSAKFRAWKQEDAARLVAQFIETYVHVARARQALLQEGIEEVPQFLAEIERQLIQVGGLPAIQQLDDVLGAHGLAKTIHSSAPPADPSGATSSSADLQPPTPPTPATTATPTLPTQQVDEAPVRSAADIARAKKIQALQDAYGKALLAHESVCDLGLPDSNNPGKAQQEQIQAIAQKAFWDILAADVSADPPDYQRVGALVADVKQMLAEILPKDKKFAEELESTLDWEVFERTLSPDLLKSFASYVIDKVVSLGAPARQANTQELLQGLCNDIDSGFTPMCIVKTFQLLTEQLTVLREDVAKYRRQLARLAIRQNAVSVQQTYVAQALSLGEMKLTRTRSWIEHSINTHHPTHPKWLANNQEYVTIVREGFLDLLQSPVALQSWTVPESWAFDVRSMVYYQNRVQHITLVACVVNIVATLCNQKCLGLSRDELLDFKQRLDKIISEPTTTLPVLSKFVTEFIGECMATPARRSNPKATVTDGDEDMVKSMLKKTADPSDPVFCAFRSKIMAALSNFCRDPPPAPEAALFTASNLNLVEADVRTLGGQVRQTYMNNTAVYGQYYANMVLGTVLQCYETEEEREGEAAPRPVTSGSAPIPIGQYRSSTPEQLARQTPPPPSPPLKPREPPVEQDDDDIDEL